MSEDVVNVDQKLVSELVVKIHDLLSDSNMAEWQVALLRLIAGLDEYVRGGEKFPENKVFYSTFLTSYKGTPTLVSVTKDLYAAAEFTAMANSADNATEGMAMVKLIERERYNSAIQVLAGLRDAKEVESNSNSKKTVH